MFNEHESKHYINENINEIFIIYMDNYIFNNIIYVSIEYEKSTNDYGNAFKVLMKMKQISRLGQPKIRLRRLES